MESILFEVKLIDLITDESPEYSGAYLILVWIKMLYELKLRKKNTGKRFINFNSYLTFNIWAYYLILM